MTQEVSNRSEDFKRFRNQYKVFSFKGYTIDLNQNGDCKIDYDFSLDGISRYRPTHIFSHVDWTDIESIHCWAFHLGLVETISYWKAYCPKYLELPVQEMGSFEQNWWKILFYKGLGEFRYLNGLMKIDQDEFCPEFLFSSQTKMPNFTKREFSSINSLNENKSILPMGGGKDSALTLALAKEQHFPVQPFAVNPIPSTFALIQEILPEANVAIVKRSIDPMLIDDNRNGALNGHTPFSAVVGMLSCAFGDMGGYQHVLLSNEASANENTVHDTEVNHQYSKSWEFEREFQSYLKNAIQTDITYSSILRPLNELQIMKAFLRRKQLLPYFVSCNVLGREGKWCGRCPKCLCIALMTAALQGFETVIKIFGRNILLDESNSDTLKQLIGCKTHKPFECVSTVGECLAALKHCQKRHPEPIDIADKLSRLMEPNRVQACRSIEEYLNDWNPSHSCSEAWEKLLKIEIEQNDPQHS